MEQENKNVAQVLLEKVAEGCADSASLLFLFEPELPECLRKEIEEE